VASNVKYLEPDDWEMVVNAERSGDGFVVRPGWRGQEWAETYIEDITPLASEVWNDGEKNRLTILGHGLDHTMYIIEWDADSGEELRKISLSDPFYGPTTSAPFYVRWFVGERWCSCVENRRCFFSRPGTTLVVGKHLLRVKDLSGGNVAVVDWIDHAGTTWANFTSEAGRIQFVQGINAVNVPYHEGSFGGSIMESHLERVWWSGFKENQQLYLHIGIPNSQKSVPEWAILDDKRQRLLLDRQTVVWSDPQNPFSVSQANYYHLPEGPITAMRQFRGSLAIFTPHSLWILEGAIQQEFSARKIAEGPGTIAPDTVRETEAGLMWLGQDNVYLWDGQTVHPLLTEAWREWVFEGRNPGVFPKRGQMDAAAVPGDSLTDGLGHPWFVHGSDHGAAIAGVNPGKKQYWLGLRDDYGIYACAHDQSAAAALGRWGNCLFLVWEWGDKGNWFLAAPHYERTTGYARYVNTMAHAHQLHHTPDGRFLAVGPSSVAEQDPGWNKDSYLYAYPTVAYNIRRGYTSSILMVSKPFGLIKAQEEFWEAIHVWLEGTLGTDAEAEVYLIPDQASIDTEGSTVETEEVRTALTRQPRSDAEYLLDGTGDWEGGWFPVRADIFHQFVPAFEISRSMRVAVVVKPDRPRFKMGRVALSYQLRSEDGVDHQPG